MKRKKITFIELALLLIMILGIIYSLIDSNVLDNKIYLTLVIIFPFTLALMLEILKINEETKEEKKEIKNEDIEVIKMETEKKIEKDKKINKKNDETIQIPINEIKKEIENINKKLTKEDDDEIGKTKVLFEKGELKGLIEKELETSRNKKTAKTVEKSNKKTNKSTETVEKDKPKSNKSTKTVDK